MEIYPLEENIHGKLWVILRKPERGKFVRTPMDESISDFSWGGNGSPRNGL